ncbi:MAG: PAS domain S-box protein [Deferribacterales bacterium]
MEARIFKSLGAYPEIDSGLSRQFSFTPSPDLADILVVDSYENTSKDKVNILITNDKYNDVLCISPSEAPEVIINSLRLIIKGYSISPRINKLRALEEQNALLSEANKGLVELYNLIESKNNQIQFLKNKLENIINSAGESIVEINEGGEIIFANNKFSTTTGYAKEQTERMNFILLLESDRRAEFVEGLKSLVGDTIGDINARLKKRDGEYIDIQGYMTLIKGKDIHYELIFQDISRKLQLEKQMKYLEEKAIVSGLSRHLSHNILNALTVAGGFLKKIKESGEQTDMMKHRWQIVDDKFKLIEEIVTGYNDYTNVINLKYTDNLDIADFFHGLIRAVSLKKFDKTFSAFLYNFLDHYEIDCTFRFTRSCRMEANKNFLKLGFCYILKDTIRYFGDEPPMKFKITTEVLHGRFAISIYVDDLDVPQPVLETMCQPWNHNMLSQSFDYWGIVIASVIMEKHGGNLSIEKSNGGMKIIMLF